MKRRLFVFGLLAVPLSTLPALAQRAAQPASDAVKVACVGDSITYGAGIRDRDQNSYPAQLGRLLGGGHVVKNFGVSGTTLLKHGDHPFWKTGQFRAATEWNPDIVIIKLGTNDTKPNNWEHKAEFATDLKAMVEAFRALPSEPQIFLCLPVPAFPDRWGIRDSVIREEVLPEIRKVAKDEKCPIIDLYQALEGKAEFFPDKIHPNKDGAAVIAKTVQQALPKLPVTRGPAAKPDSKSTSKPEPKPAPATR